MIRADTFSWPWTLLMSKACMIFKISWSAAEIVVLPGQFQ